MKKRVISFSLVMTIIVVIISCSKNEDNPVPAERKKCAWVSGSEDSTGYGMILYSSDAGETWVRQGQGTTALQGIGVLDIWALDENNVWATGTNNVILRTINGGQTWTRVPALPNQANTELMSISIVNNTNIWISGSGGTVYNSIDGGLNWTMFDTTFFQSGGMQGIWAINSQRIFVVGGVAQIGQAERGFVGYTVDGGATWESFVPTNDYNKNEWIGVVSNGNTVVIYGGKSHYMMSTDEGETWRNDSVSGAGGGGTPADINHLIMLNSQTWWGAFDMGHIGLTTDGGLTWSIQETGHGGDYLVGIDAWDSQLALAVGTSEGLPKDVPILKTSNGGANWEVKHTYNSNLNKVTFIKE